MHDHLLAAVHPSTCETARGHHGCRHLPSGVNFIAGRHFFLPGGTAAKEAANHHHDERQCGTHANQRNVEPFHVLGGAVLLERSSEQLVINSGT